jgi:hypothetical protein
MAVQQRFKNLRQCVQQGVKGQSFGGNHIQ